MTPGGPTVRRPYVIGVTGNIACGKSTVLRALADLGAATIDADRVYHDLIAPGRPLNDALVARFGPSIRSADGSIDRRALGAIVFADPAALADLDRLTHPAVRQEVLRRIDASDAAVVAIDAVKLVESGFDRFCDAVWLVECTPEQQLERLMHRNALTAEEARRRIAAQPALEPKRAAASVIIDNSGDEAETRVRIQNRWRELPILPV